MVGPQISAQFIDRLPALCYICFFLLKIGRGVTNGRSPSQEIHALYGTQMIITMIMTIDTKPYHKPTPVHILIITGRQHTILISSALTACPTHLIFPDLITQQLLVKHPMLGFLSIGDNYIL